MTMWREPKVPPDPAGPAWWYCHDPARGAVLAVRTGTQDHQFGTVVLGDVEVVTLLRRLRAAGDRDRSVQPLFDGLIDLEVEVCSAVDRRRFVSEKATAPVPIAPGSPIREVRWTAALGDNAAASRDLSALATERQWLDERTARFSVHSGYPAEDPAAWFLDMVRAEHDHLSSAMLYLAAVTALQAEQRTGAPAALAWLRTEASMADEAEHIQRTAVVEARRWAQRLFPPVSTRFSRERDRRSVALSVALEATSLALHLHGRVPASVTSAAWTPTLDLLTDGAWFGDDRSAGDLDNDVLARIVELGPAQLHELAERCLADREQVSNDALVSYALLVGTGVLPPRRRAIDDQLPETQRGPARAALIDAVIATSCFHAVGRLTANPVAVQLTVVDACHAHLR